jgi:hypothetical protein
MQILIKKQKLKKKKKKKRQPWHRGSKLELPGRWRLGGSQFQASPGRKLGRPCFNQWLILVACAYQPSYVGSITRKIKVQAIPGIKQDPMSKIIKVKRAEEWLKWQSA